MEKVFAEKFGRNWVDAWNTRDIDKILSHYSDDFELASPVICEIAKEPTGILKGKEAIQAYWTKALQLNPELNFQFIAAFAGVDSMIVHYQGHRGLSAEIFYFNRNAKIYRSSAHYQ